MADQAQLEVPRVVQAALYGKRYYKTSPAPEADTKSPSYKMPEGSVDAHCHVSGPWDKYRFDPESTYFPLGGTSLESLQKMHGVLGIQRAVIVNTSCNGPYNESLIDAIALSRGNYRGVINANPRLTEGDYVTLHQHGIRAVRFNFVKHLGGAPNMDELYSVIDRIKDLGWHLVFHFDSKDLRKYGPVLDGLPIPYVIDHMGRVDAKEGIKQPTFQDLLARARNDERFWIKVSGADRVAGELNLESAIPFAQALIEAAPDRVLWGTDWHHPNPLGTMPNDGDLADLIPKIATTLEAQTNLLVSNPNRLYWGS